MPGEGGQTADQGLGFGSVKGASAPEPPVLVQVIDEKATGRPHRSRREPEPGPPDTVFGGLHYDDAPIDKLIGIAEIQMACQAFQINRIQPDLLAAATAFAAECAIEDGSIAGHEARLAEDSFEANVLSVFTRLRQEREIEVSRLI